MVWNMGYGNYTDEGIREHVSMLSHFVLINDAGWRINHLRLPEYFSYHSECEDGWGYLA